MKAHWHVTIGEWDIKVIGTREGDRDYSDETVVKHCGQDITEHLSEYALDEFTDKAMATQPRLLPVADPVHTVAMEGA